MVMERDFEEFMEFGYDQDDPHTLRPSERESRPDPTELDPAPLWEVAIVVAQGTHCRLGAQSPFQLIESADLLSEILRGVPIIVPDHVQTLKQAVKMAIPGQEIFLRGCKDEYIVGANEGQPIVAGKRESGDAILEIRKPVSISGEKGTLLRGMLHMKQGAEGGRIRNLTLQDAGQCCLRAETGTWMLENCFLLCGHASALRAEGNARVVGVRTRIGGEGALGEAVATEYELPRQWIDTAGSVQEYGLVKNSCYGIFVKDRASVWIDSSEISYCSESAVFLRDMGSVRLRGCELKSCHVGFTAGADCHGSLQVTDACTLNKVKRIWYDDDRPPSTLVEDF